MYDMSTKGMSNLCLPEAPAIQKDVVQASSTASAAPVKGQGQIEQITQSSKVVANGDEEEEEVAQQARINLIDWDPVSMAIV